MKIGSLLALRLQCQLMAFPPRPGACQPPPAPAQPLESGKAQLGPEPQARTGHRRRSLPAGVRLDFAAPAWGRGGGGTSSQSTKSQESLAALKNSLEENLEAGTVRDHGGWNLRSELESDYRGHWPSTYPHINLLLCSLVALSENVRTKWTGLIGRC